MFPISSLTPSLLFLHPNRCRLLDLDFFGNNNQGDSTGGEVLKENSVCEMWNSNGSLDWRVAESIIFLGTCNWVIGYSIFSRRHSSILISSWFSVRSMHSPHFRLVNLNSSRLHYMHLNWFSLGICRYDPIPHDSRGFCTFHTWLHQPYSQPFHASTT